MQFKSLQKTLAGMAEMLNEEICEIILNEGEAGLAKVSDFSKIKLEGKEGGGEAQMVSSSKSKQGSSLARLPDDMLHYILTSFLLFKDLLRLDWPGLSAARERLLASGAAQVFRSLACVT